MKRLRETGRGKSIQASDCWQGEIQQLMCGLFSTVRSNLYVLNKWQQFPYFRTREIHVFFCLHFQLQNECSLLTLRWVSESHQHDFPCDLKEPRLYSEVFEEQHKRGHSSLLRKWVSGRQGRASLGEGNRSWQFAEPAEAHS